MWHLVRALTAAGVVAAALGTAPLQAEAIEPGILKGRAVTTDGRPLAGAEVVADNQFFYNANAIAVTGDDGSYRIDTSRLVGTYQASARIMKRYNGTSYVFALAPDVDEPFAGNAGAVRNFVWRTSGPMPDGDRDYGSKIIIYAADILDPRDGGYVDDRNILLTVVPEGPRIDGSTGAPLTARGETTADGTAIRDMVVGRYRISAVYAAEGAAPRPMLVRPRNRGAFGPEMVADFEVLMEGIQMINVEARLAD